MTEFISLGDGCTKAARLLGFMGLQNDTTMQSRSFSMIEERVAAERSLTQKFAGKRSTDFDF
jgi:hypothetical protein